MRGDAKMKKQIYFVSGILVGILLMITLSISTAKAEEFRFVPANTDHIMATAKVLKADADLGVLILCYSEKIGYHDIDDLVASAREVEEAYLFADIDPKRVIIGFANKKGQLEKEHKFKTNGIYIQLFRKRITK